MRIFVLALVLVACSKSPREQAKAYVDDTSLSAADAFTKAASAIYPDVAKVWVEGPRVFVIADRDDKPGFDRKENTITFWQVLDGKRVEQDMDLMAAGASRKVTEVLIADRYHATVDGKPYTILDPRRTIALDEYKLQSFDTWEPADLEKAKPYDLLMGKRM